MIVLTGGRNDFNIFKFIFITIVKLVNKMFKLWYWGKNIALRKKEVFKENKTCFLFLNVISTNHIISPK